MTNEHRIPDGVWRKLETGCVTHLEAAGLSSSPCWPEFRARLDVEFRGFAELLWSLYGEKPDFAYRVEGIVADLFRAFESRPEHLKERDRARPPESGWFLGADQVGAVCYVDRFAGTFRGVGKRIPYLKELGVTYLHLMPFFRCPEDENDGGYAVSSYRETDPALGSMSDLESLARELDAAGISLVADFVFNHTSDRHDWAMAAKAGDPEFQDYYLMFHDRAETEEYGRTLRDIFPEVRKGSFTWSEGLRCWVWTTFHPFQWDLNYRNPSVFAAMAREMTSLANRGIAFLRLDAVAFVWKRKGSPCENLPEAHTIIRAFQVAARLACPSLLFKSEAIVHPDDIERYIDLRECQVSYNPLLMAELWEAAATKEVKLLSYSMRQRHRLPPGCAWVNYVRSHDDIGWTFSDEDAAALGMKGNDHRSFLNSFYLGEFPGSFARGLSFQYNPATGDRRICGSAASLAGIQRAREEGSAAMMDTAVNRLLLLYGIAFSAGGIPLIYLGDELATENDPGWASDPARAGDSRWVHRQEWSDRRAAQRKDPGTVAGRAFAGISRMSALRKAHCVFGERDLSVLETGHPSVLAFRKRSGDAVLTVVGSFSESPAAIDQHWSGKILAPVPGSGAQVEDLLTGRRFGPEEQLELPPCGLLWLYSEAPAGS